MLGGAIQGARGEAMLELFQTSWVDLTARMPELAEAGYTSLWLPPPAKGGSVFSVGYDHFDPFDLGDKNQRGTVPTKYGTRDQLIKMVETAHRFGIRVYFDNIMNHRAFDVPGYNGTTPTNIYPGLIPKDFHLQTISGGFYRNWPSVENYGNQWDVQYESLSGLIDLANEPGSVNGNFGNSLGSTTTKPNFIRQPNNRDYYMDPTKPNLGSGWRPFNGTNGVPVAEDVNAYLIRAAMWTLYVTKCDGFRLDAVKHTPSNFFGNNDPYGGYTGGIQAMYDWVHGYGTNLNSTYLETDDPRNSCFDSEASRNDALLFGEHLGEPPSYSEYIAAGMRLLNTPMRSAVDGWAGGGTGAGLDQRDIGSYGANQGVQFAQDQDHALCCVNNRALHNAYYFMHEGIPMIYSDAFNYAGDPSSSSTFPIVPQANYLGEYGDNQMPDIAYLHHQLARGGTRSRWSDANIVAWERYDYRDVASGDPFNDPTATVVLFVANNKTGASADINFDDGISRTADGYYTCGPGGNPSRGYAMKVGFPPGSVLSQLASSAPGSDRACAKLIVHDATTSSATATSTANDPNPVHRALVVNSTPPTGGGAIELRIPTASWVMYGYQWPEPSRANVLTNAITFKQGGTTVPTLTVYRKDGPNGDANYNPIYPFKMRGSVDANGNVIGGVHVSNRTYTIDVPILTNGPMDIAIRSDASTVNVQAKMDGGIDLNSQMGLGSPTTGLERRDNRPGSASDVFLGYEQTTYQLRNGPEKFAAKNTTRCNVTSLGAETYYYTVGGTNTLVNGGGNGAGINTSTPSFVYHDPAAATTLLGGGGPATQMNPTNPTPSQAVDLWFKVGYNYQSNRCYVYFTTDGSNPEGAFGVGKGTTKVVAGTWMNHDAGDNTIDWFKATIPGSYNLGGVQLRYKAALYQEGIGTISDSDNSKLYGLTQFGITNFNPTTVTVWTHNDRNTNSTTTGLTTGFHILRGRTFLSRSGKSGVYNTFAQTFYYDGQLPQGVIVFPTNNAAISNTTYQVVVRADSATTGVEFNIQDGDSNNDDSITGLRQGNGLTNGVQVFAQATSVTPDGTLSGIYTNYPQEYRFTYVAVPNSGSATIAVRLREFTSSLFPNRVTLLTNTVTTAAPVQVVQISDPASDGLGVNVSPDAPYPIRVCFSTSLSNSIDNFSIYINGIFQQRRNPGTQAPYYIIGGTTCGAGFRTMTYNWANASTGTNVIQVVYSGAVTLSDTRSVIVAPPLVITGLANNNQLVVWDSASGINYQVLATTNLSAPFVPISPVIAGSGDSTFYYDNSDPVPQKFYQIQVVP